MKSTICNKARFYIIPVIWLTGKIYNRSINEHSIVEQKNKGNILSEKEGKWIVLLFNSYLVGYAGEEADDNTHCLSFFRL